MQARTLEIYSHLGIVERALELGKRATGANMWAHGRRTARVPLGDIGRELSPYPFLLILGQDDNERLLGEALRDRGMDVQWNTELVGLEQKPGPRHRRRSSSRTARPARSRPRGSPAATARTARCAS